EERNAGGAVAAARALRERQLRLDLRRRLEDDEAAVGEQTGQVARERLVVALRVRRVAEDEVVAATLVRDRLEDVWTGDLPVPAEPVQVALDRPARFGVAFDEDGACRAARERLEAHGAGACKEVEHLCVLD